jgi:hypothetical protein
LPFGLSISSHVFTTYFAIHLEIAKGRYLSTLIPKCVQDKEELGNPAWLNYERCHYGVIHRDKETRRLFTKYEQVIMKAGQPKPKGGRNVDL